MRIVPLIVLSAASMILGACATQEVNTQPIGQEINAYRDTAFIPASWQTRLFPSPESREDIQYDAPAPFTGTEIREGTEEGLMVFSTWRKLNLQTGEMMSLKRYVVFKDCEEETVKVEAGMDGGPTQFGSVQRWADLASHGNFSIGTIRLRRTLQIEPSAKPVDCLVYITPRIDTTLKIVVFDSEKRGAPILLQTWTNGKLVMEIRETGRDNKQRMRQ